MGTISRSAILFTLGLVLAACGGASATTSTDLTPSNTPTTTTVETPAASETAQQEPVPEALVDLLRSMADGDVDGVESAREELAPDAPADQFALWATGLINAVPPTEYGSFSTCYPRCWKLSVQKDGGVSFFNSNGWHAISDVETDPDGLIRAFAIGGRPIESDLHSDLGEVEEAGVTVRHVVTYVGGSDQGIDTYIEVTAGDQPVTLDLPATTYTGPAGEGAMRHARGQDELAPGETGAVALFALSPAGIGGTFTLVGEVGGEPWSVQIPS